ncbi:hypothetical protein CFE70_004102 [Pyrenophora teres f. teres 0-1]|uniref:Uncharacterized protein n=2 Tax=Pyrenophora teres f. teres TaxID=97479 RepID=E3S7S6_PYRTT|nr:hypothetical protein PTT_18908 [Pyrenophora teres f. teres 0-1]KAE8833052.1 hypothetical protein HRS9139_04871 [Pyrenophora teres f. teres]CAA9960728.1 DUF1509 multi-domain protein [Pyrenophora teres f. maculata]KAE8841179.1 hypothetical protein PTNB85_04578 [Pyrenophora teres f. teres]KAE8848683.1 hypothetical protein HRS9122_02699 [Pyrenophora teres f. teres]
MENTQPELYSDYPEDTQSTSQRERDTSPSSSTSSTTIKPLPSIPHIVPYTDEEPYRDDPTAHAPTPTASSSPPTRSRIPEYLQPSREPPRYQAYSDSPPPTPAAGDVPLANLLYTHTYSHSTETSWPLIDSSYPAEAPPSYAIAVRQSYRDTLTLYLPGPHQDSDEESQAGMDYMAADDIRHNVEKVVAMFVVAMMLLLASGVLGWLALGSGIV